jgi:hypothetical protein
MWVVVLVAVAFFGWLSNKVVHRAAQNQVDEQTRYSPPLKEMPPPSRKAIINEDAAALHVEVDLDGTAVVHPDQVRGLVRSDGSFRTDLTLEELARARPERPKNRNARFPTNQSRRRSVQVKRSAPFRNGNESITKARNGENTKDTGSTGWTPLSSSLVPLPNRVGISFVPSSFRAFVISSTTSIMSHDMR